MTEGGMLDFVRRLAGFGLLTVSLAYVAVRMF